MIDAAVSRVRWDDYRSCDGARQELVDGVLKGLRCRTSSLLPVVLSVNGAVHSSLFTFCSAEFLRIVGLTSRQIVERP